MLTCIIQICATRLSEQFPDSPRVAVLLGTVLEGRGQVDEAKALYEKRLQINESDLVSQCNTTTQLAAPKLRQ